MVINMLMMKEEKCVEEQTKGWNTANWEIEKREMGTRVTNLL